MAFRSPENIRENAIAFIDSRLSGIRTETGEPIIDMIDAVAMEQGKLYVIAEYLRRINSIDGWLALITDTVFKASLADALGISATTLSTNLARSLGVPDDIENDVEAILFYDLNRFAASFGVPRKDATYATTTERLYLSTNSPFTLLRGANIRVGGDSNIVFSTVDDVIAQIPGYDAVTNSFFLDVGLRCRTAGVLGNQIRGAIRVVSPTIQNVTRATNLIPAEGGLDRPTNAELLASLVDSISGRDIATTGGLLKFLLSQDDVFDAILVGPGDPLMVRAPAGAIDAYVIGTRLVTVPVQTTPTASGQQYFFPYQPLKSFNSAQNLSSLVSYQPGSGMQLSFDMGNFRGSAKANDSIIWDPSTGPAPAETVQVNYTYNGLLRDLQLQIDSDPTLQVPAASILLREALLIQAVASMKVVVIPGVDQTLAEQAVLTALQVYFSSLKLGQLAEYSDALIAAGTAKINGILVVDRIDDFLIAALGSPLAADNIPAARNEYTRLYSVTFESETGLSQ